MQAQLTMQIGKNGLTETFKEQIKTNFKNRENIKISILKTACRDREKLRQMSDEILASLGNRYTCRVVGFSLFLKKWRKPRVKK